MITPAELQENIDHVQDRISAAAAKSGRSAKDITLVAVGKTHPAEFLIPAIELGLDNFGENRIQESEEKIPKLSEYNVRWHMIGHLQRNKAAEAIELFDEFHAIDSKRLARRLQKQLEKADRERFDTFVQVNVSGEKSKYGLDPENLGPLLETVSENCPRLFVKGLMTIAPWTEDEEVLRKTFQNLRVLLEQSQSYNSANIRMESLSMGMTNDYEIAVEEGSTHLRIGRALFGERRER